MTIEIRFSGNMTKGIESVNTVRGFPEGFSLEEYPKAHQIETISPGILKAHQKVESFLNSRWTAQCDFDDEGNPSITLPKKLYDIIKTEKTT